ncbi:hypothetical protein K443DRAFT_114165, partial [Laccaria amethystina LaAM-08-1]
PCTLPQIRTLHFHLPYNGLVNPGILLDAVTLFLTVKMFEHRNTETLHNSS